MQKFRHAGGLLLGALLAAALPACNKHNAESPANPPTGIATKTTPDTGGTGTEQPSVPAAGAGNSAGSATPASSPPGASTPPAGQQSGK